MKFMGRLFSKYADPFTLLNGYIQTCRFCEFIKVFQEEEQEDLHWQIYLHKVWDKSFAEFKESLRISQDLQNMSKLDVEATVKESMSILGNFNPEGEN